MNFKFSIGKKIGLGFGLLLFCTITIFLTTRLTLDSSKKINKHNTVTLSPSVDELQELKIQILVVGTHQVEQLFSLIQKDIS